MEKEDLLCVCVCSSSLHFAVIDLAELLSVHFLVAITSHKQSKEKIFIFIFFGVFSKN